MRAHGARRVDLLRFKPLLFLKTWTENIAKHKVFECSDGHFSIFPVSTCSFLEFSLSFDFILG